MTTVTMDVAEIRFTQEHVYDSFNANSAKAGGTVELIEAILAGKKTPSDLPLIRVAPKRGAYWCVDNRRLFVYKHCQLGKIPVEVYDWKDMREFELKWRNGLATRGQTGEGRRVGVLQRTETPFPRSPVAEPALSKILRHMSPEQQRKHDAQIAALRRRREQREAVETAAGASSASVEAAESLRGLLLPAAGQEESKRCAAARKKRRRGAQAEAPDDAQAEVSGPSESAAATAMELAGTDAPGKTKKRRKKAAVAKQGDGPPEPSENTELAERNAGEAPGPKAKRRKASGKKSTVAATQTAVEGQKANPGPSAPAGSGGPVKLTVAMAQEDSSDEAYNVEVIAM